MRQEHTDGATAATLAEYRDIVVGELVDVHLSLASHYATQTDYKGAQREVNEALALDPDNRAALGMRARIEENASRGLRWW